MAFFRHPLKSLAVIVPHATGLDAAPFWARVLARHVGEKAGGVTGLGLKPAVTPDGTVGTERVTGELKEPRDCTATLIVPTPPGLRVRLLGVTVIVNAAPVVVVVTAITVNGPLADFPVLPTARTL